MPHYGACNLGSVNLTRFVEHPFTPEASLDVAGIQHTVGVAVRLMDNVIDASLFPLDDQARQARGSRRLGLGLTGLADAFIMLGLRYGDEDSYRLAAEIMATICHSAYRASAELAREKGPFPEFDETAYLAAEKEKLRKVVETELLAEGLLPLPPPVKNPYTEKE